MRYILLSLLILTILCSCKNHNEVKGVFLKTIERNKQDSIKEAIANLFKDDERIALDSIKFYGLDSVYNECERILYVIFGCDTIRDEKISQPVRVGECNIRLIHFINSSPKYCFIMYLLFLDDLTPMDPGLKIRNGRVPLGFTIDKKNKMIVKVNSGDGDGIDYHYFKELYIKVLRDPLFDKKIQENGNKLNPKFIRILEELHK